MEVAVTRPNGSHQVRKALVEADSEQEARRLVLEDVWYERLWVKKFVAVQAVG
jgi:hypothetical protein